MYTAMVSINSDSPYIDYYYGLSLLKATLLLIHAGDLFPSNTENTQMK